MHEKPPASRDGSFVDWVRSQIASEGYLCNVYDLGAKAFGTFDMVFFFGVLYHLRNRSSPWKECSAFVPVRSCCKPRRTRCPVPSPVSRSVARATAGRREGSMVLSR